MPGGMIRARATVHWTIMISTVMPRPNEARQTRGSGHSIASDRGPIAIAAPMTTTNSIGRRGVNRSETRPPAIRPTASAAVIAPQAAGPPRCALATTGPRIWNAPYQAISTTPNCATIAHSQVCERNSDQPSRRSRSMPVPPVPALAVARMLSRIGTEPSMPTPHAASAQPGPNAATHRPAPTPPPVRRQTPDRAGLLQQPGRHQPGQQRLRRGIEDRHAGPGECLEHDHLPQLRTAGQDQDAERALAERDHDVAGDDHPLRRDPVRNDPA